VGSAHANEAPPHFWSIPQVFPHAALFAQSALVTHCEHVPVAVSHTDPEAHTTAEPTFVHDPETPQTASQLPFPRQVASLVHCTHVPTEQKGEPLVVQSVLAKQETQEPAVTSHFWDLAAQSVTVDVFTHLASRHCKPPH